MKNQHKKDPIDVLGEVYETMFEQAVEGVHKVEEVSAPLLHELIDEAKEEAVKLEKVTREEGEKLSDWLKQDLNEAAHFFSESEAEVSDWLGFEASALKSAALDKLLSVDRETKQQIIAFKGEIARRLYPRTGEVTGAGTLVCDKCGEKLHFHQAGKIPPCPKCRGTSFHRGLSL